MESLEPTDAPTTKPKRKKSTSPTARTLAECRKRGWLAGIVERRIPFPKPQGTTFDLFGVIDIIAIDPSRPVGQRTIGIQATTNGSGNGKGGRHAEHRDKILAEPRALIWVDAGNPLELWSWSPAGARGKRKLWTLRVETYEEMVAARGQALVGQSLRDAATEMLEGLGEAIRP